MKGISIKKIAAEVDVKKLGVNGYIISEEGKEYGLFFRSPIQKVMASYDPYYMGEGDVNAFEIKAKYDTNRLYRFWQNLLGNKHAFKMFGHEADDIDVIGRKIKVLTSPIYLSRPYRRTKAIGSGSCAFKKVVSYGFEGYKNNVSGSCDTEKTRIVFKDGTRTTVVKHNDYYYTYKHVIEDELTA
jgi:hypothetical protein